MQLVASHRYQNSVIHVIGYVSLAMLIGIVPCLLFSFAEGENYWNFLVPFIICAILAIAILPFTKMPDFVRPVSGLTMIFFMWIISIAIGSIPFIMAGMNGVDAIFESTSGITTTGSTIMSDIESWPFSILLWRSVMQWIGGIAIIIIFMLLLPMIGFGGRELFGNETAGSGGMNLSIKLRDAGKQFIMIYITLTVILIAILLILGVRFGDTLCLAFSTVSTGGFMCKADSLASYGMMVKFVVAVFMFLGGTNFYLHFKALYRKNSKGYIWNEEFRVMFFLNIATIAAVFLLLNSGPVELSYEKLNQLVDVGLNVVSASTTTGFAASNYDLWTEAAVLFLFVVMIIGGSTGSTSGGVKVGRVLLLIKYVHNGIMMMLHPKGIYGVRMNGNSVDKNTLSLTIIITTLFMFTVFIGTIIVMMFGIEFKDSLSIIIANLTTFGPAIGAYGPFGSYSELNPLLKLFLAFLMWLGRLEILTGLILLTPTFWREVMMSRRKKLGEYTGGYNKRFRN